MNPFGPSCPMLAPSEISARVLPLLVYMALVITSSVWFGLHPSTTPTDVYPSNPHHPSWKSPQTGPLLGSDCGVLSVTGETQG